MTIETAVMHALETIDAGLGAFALYFVLDLRSSLKSLREKVDKNSERIEHIEKQLEAVVVG